MSPEWPNLVYGKPWKTQILRKFQFLKVVMVLGCPKCILEEFRIFLKNFYFFFQFSLLLGHFLQGFWIFWHKISPKWLNLVYGKSWKIQILTRLRFLKVVKKFKILAKNCQKVVKNCKSKFRKFSKIFETPPECILGIRGFH